ncbi:glycosyltransferase family 2 protein [Ureibacillus manganicus]|uniref:glycosyltransferase family 2 protein n=1 Tax=Ureibacillus manganicus TaxID=1266064 RepID=UPI000691BACB|nr:glycosyltransferase family 2 protein [Ureibacillus manganicus]
MPKISIIIPVYNSELYIRKCVDSILSQTFKDFEAIFINDGSIDSTSCILDKYKQIDNRVRVLHQENKGPSAARNLGVNSATGDFLLFIDSDDWIESYMLDEMYKVMMEKNPDLVFCGISNDYIDTGITILTSYNLPSGVLLDNSYIKNVVYPNLLKNGLYSSPCNKLLKRHVVEKVGLMDEKLDYGEDWKYMLDLFDTIDSMLYIDKNLYHYNHRDNDSLTKKFRANSFDMIALWMYEMSKKYAEKWGVSLEGSSERLCLQTINCIIMEFSTENKLSNSEKMGNIVRYINHPFLLEALKNIDKNQFRLNHKFFIFLITKKCKRLLFIYGFIYLQMKTLVKIIKSHKRNYT